MEASRGLTRTLLEGPPALAPHVMHEYGEHDDQAKKERGRQQRHHCQVLATPVRCRSASRASTEDAAQRHLPHIGPDRLGPPPQKPESTAVQLRIVAVDQTHASSR